MENYNPSTRGMVGGHDPAPSLDPASGAPHPHARRHERGWWWKLPMMLVMVLTGAGMVGTFWLHQTYADRVYPNVLLQGIQIGGQTRPDVQQTVEQAYAAFLDAPVTLRYSDRSWHPSAADLGVTVDWEATLDQVFAVGHSDNVVTDAVQWLELRGQPRNMPLHIAVNSTYLDAYVREIAKEIDIQPQDATITFANGTVEITPSAEGREVLLAETTDAIVAALQQLQPQEITIQTRELVPQTTTERVTEVRQEIEMMVGAPLELVAKDQNYTLTIDMLSELLDIEQTERDGVLTSHAQLDPSALETYVRQISEEVRQVPVEPRVNWNNGQLEIFKEGTPGYALDIEQSIKAIQDAARTSSREVELPIKEVLPQVRAETLNQLGITELIAEGKSFFTGSPQFRVTNIKAGVNLIHGIFVPPGGEFSFNNTVGERLDASKGFVPGIAIIGDKKVKSDGGGICQVSTTMFRAAFYAGLPITERWAHGYRLHYYEIRETIGMDAAIFTGTGPDLKFVNDTGNWILIQGHVDTQKSSVTFGIYGTQVPGRTIERSAPVVSQRANGVTYVRVTRTLKLDGAVIDTEAFESNFRPHSQLQEEEE